MNIAQCILSPLSIIKHTAMLFSLSLLPNLLHCMQNNPSSMLIKLNDLQTYKAPTDLMLYSNTLHKKCLWKERLAINPQKPIVVDSISPDQLVLFTHAAYKTEDSFAVFFETLTENDKKNLLSICGSEVLDSPHITSLIAQNYLPKDIIEMHIKPHINTKKISHYVQCAMIKKNMQNNHVDPLSFLNFKKNCKKIAHPNGTVHQIPEYFDADGSVCTTTRLKGKIFENDDYITHLHKRLDNCEYRITTTIPQLSNELPITYIERLRDNQLPEKHVIAHNKKVKRAICSENGRYIALRLNQPKDNIVLISLDPSTDEIISSQKTFTNNLKYSIHCAFDHNSESLCELSTDISTETSQLFTYFMNTQQEQCVPIPNCCRSITFNHDYSSSMTNHIKNNTQTITFMQKKDLHSSTIIHSIPITTNDVITEVQYNHRGNMAVGQSLNGNLFFFEHNGTDEIDMTYSENPYLSASDRQTVLSVGLLFTPDDNFLISFTNSLIEETINGCITVWSTKLKQCIAHGPTLPIAKKKSPEIIMSKNEQSFIINQFLNPWIEYRLFFPMEDFLSRTWIGEKRSLFTLYGLNRLYRTHKNNEQAILTDDDLNTTMLYLLPNLPSTLFPCIKEYLIIQHKKSLAETMTMHAQNFTNACEEILDNCTSFFKNFNKN